MHERRASSSASLAVGDDAYAYDYGGLRAVTSMALHTVWTYRPIAIPTIVQIDNTHRTSYKLKRSQHLAPTHSYTHRAVSARRESGVGQVTAHLESDEIFPRAAVIFP